MTNDSVNQAENLETEEQVLVKEKDDDEEEELRKLLVPRVEDLPLIPPSAVDSNFVAYFAPDFIKAGHDQYVYRHANGLCVIGLVSTHMAFKDEGGITAVDLILASLIVVGLRSLESEKRMHNILNQTQLYVKFAPILILILLGVVLRALCWK